MDTAENKTKVELAMMDRQIAAAEELAANYNDDTRQDIKTDVINAFHRGVTYGQSFMPNEPDNPLIMVNHTLGGFKAAFYVTHRRAPTEQEIFDAGVRSGLLRADDRLRAAMA